MFPFFCFVVFWRFRDDRRILVGCSGEGRAGGGGKGEEGGREGGKRAVVRGLSRARWLVTLAKAR